MSTAIRLEPVEPGTIGAKPCTKCGMHYMVEGPQAGFYKNGPSHPIRSECKECCRLKDQEKRPEPLPMYEVMEIYKGKRPSRLIKRFERVTPAIAFCCKSYLSRCDGVRTGEHYAVIYQGKILFEFNDDLLLFC